VRRGSWTALFLLSALFFGLFCLAQQRVFSYSKVYWRGGMNPLRNGEHGIRPAHFNNSWCPTGTLNCAGKNPAASIFKITAYCPCVKCCGKSDGITASNKKARPNHTIACNWLPFGTKVNINGHTYTVEDRGAVSQFGSNKNPIKHIDIFFPSHLEAKKFGVRYLPVEIMKPLASLDQK